MEYKKLGNTGIEVSKIAFGAEYMVERPYEDSEALIKACEENGINFVDCWMSEPDVRSHLGKAIAPNRDFWVIQGHIGATWQNNQYVKSRDMDKVIPAFEDFMQRFQIDTLDFGMIHYVDELNDLETILNGEFIEYVRKMKEEGIIRHIGLSTHNPEIAKLATEIEDLELIMFSINPAYDMLSSFTIEKSFEENVFDDDFEGIAPNRAELYQLCEEKNIAITVMKAFAGGRLLSDDSPFGVALTPVQCLEYCLSRPAVKSVFVGAKNIEEMSESIYYEMASDEEKDYASVLVNAPRNSYEGQCTYCGHCAPCPMKINVAMVSKFYDLARVHDDVPDSVREHYNNMEANASDCTACGDCEKRCPFNVDVVDIMEKADSLFGGT